MTDARRVAAANVTPRIRTERLIAIGRVVMAAFSLLAVWLEGVTPARYAQASYALLGGYLVYAVVLASAVWLARGPRARLVLVTHALDLALFSLFIYLADALASPFFTFFAFALVAATARWQWRGAVWTAVAALVSLNGVGVAANVIRDPDLRLDWFMMRSVYLVVLGGLLTFLGAHEERRRRDMARLAAWPRGLPEQRATMLREILESAARVLEAPRVLLVWEEAGEPWLQFALWTGPHEFRLWREPPDAFPFLVAEPLARTDFLSLDVRAPRPLVLHTSPAGLEEWHGAALHPLLQARFGITAVLALQVAGECFDGRLLSLDQRSLTADDLMLGEVVTRQVAASLDHLLVSRRLRQAAAAEERMRVFRDLHDGVLQSLAGAGLHLETVRQLLETEPEAARARLADVQRLVATEQRALRLFIRDSKLIPAGAAPADGPLETRLHELVPRLEALWGARVSLELGPLNEGRLGSLAADVCHIVQEAVVNAARHGGASEVRVRAGLRNGSVCVGVSDNGRGFSFRGHYDHATLTAQRLGPVTLKQRVNALGGSLSIDSTAGGARLEIELPCPDGGE